MSAKELKGSDEEDSGTYLGEKRVGGDKKAEEDCCDEGGRMLFMLHQLGFPAIICYTDQLCKTPHFIPSLPTKKL